MKSAVVHSLVNRLGTHFAEDDYEGKEAEKDYISMMCFARMVIQMVLSDKQCEVREESPVLRTRVSRVNKQLIDGWGLCAGS